MNSPARDHVTIYFLIIIIVLVMAPFKFDPSESGLRKTLKVKNQKTYDPPLRDKDKKNGV